MTIKITFDPNSPTTIADAKIKDIFNNRTARNLWCLWRRGHIVSQHFNDAILEITERIDALKFVTVQGLIDSFQSYRYHDFNDENVASFVGDHVFYFSSPLEYPLSIIRVKEKENQMKVREQKELNDKPLSECPECVRPTDQEELDMFGGVCEKCRYTDDE